MIFAVIGILIIAWGIFSFIFSLFKKMPKWKRLWFIPIGVAVLIFGALSDSNLKNAPITSAESFVIRYKNKDIDDILDAFTTLDETIADEVAEQIADSSSTMWLKPITATGKIVEFSEGYRVPNVHIITPAGYKVRVSRRKIHFNLKIGDDIEVRGDLASPLDKLDHLFIRNATIYLK